MPLSNECTADLLQHIETYELGVVQFAFAVLKRRHERLTKQDLQQSMRTLSREKRLLQFPLVGRSVYYQLPAELNRTSSTPGEDATRAPRVALAEIDKIRKYAMLAICCRDGELMRHRRTGDEFCEWIGDSRERHSGIFCAPFHSHDQLYVVNDRLGKLVVDFGGTGRWDRVLGRCARLLAKYRRHTDFQRRMIRGQFELMIVTSTRQKANRLRNALAAEPLDPRVPIEVEAVPALLDFIAPQPLSSTTDHPTRVEFRSRLTSKEKNRQL